MQEEQHDGQALYPAPMVALRLPHITAIRPRPASLDLQLDHLVSYTAQESILARTTGFQMVPRGGADFVPNIIEKQTHDLEKDNHCDKEL